MQHSPLERLEIILNAMQRAQGFTEGLDREAFGGDRRTCYATIHCLDVVGSVAAEVPADIRAQLPDSMAGVREDQGGSRADAVL